MSEVNEISDVLTNLSKPKTDATLTLRIIKSFEFRTEKSVVLHGINLDTTTLGDLKAQAKQGTIISCTHAPRAMLESPSLS
jgi:hypothetical protein